MVLTQEVEKASDKAHALDAETTALMSSIRSKNNKAMIAFIVCWSILLVVGIIGLYKQNQLAAQNNRLAQESKDHIDCVVKLFTTPLPPGARSRVLANPETTCDIKFAP